MAAKEVPRSALKFVVFLGTVREGNYGSRAGKFIVRKLNEKGFQVNYLGKSATLVVKFSRFYCGGQTTGALQASCSSNPGMQSRTYLGNS